MPQIGSSVRARWSRIVADRRDLQTAFAFEAVVDESVFVLGPTVVTLLATAVHPLAGLGTAAAAGVVGTAVLVSQRGTEPPPGAHSETLAAPDAVGRTVPDGGLWLLHGHAASAAPRSPPWRSATRRGTGPCPG